MKLMKQASQNKYKATLTVFLLMLSVASFSQSVNDYKYVIVPVKFDFQKQKDAYRLNTLTKMILEKYGFVAFLSSDDIPEAILSKKCQILYANLEEKKNFINTQLKITLSDCKEKVLYETAYGLSRDKDYNIAFNQALREASKSFDQLHYNYNGANEVAVETVVPQTQPIVPETATPTPSSPSTDTAEVFFFAQPIANGFQVVNNEPRVIMRLLMTSQKNVFIGIKDNIQGVVLFKNNQWFFEYYENGKLISELLKLKF